MTPDDDIELKGSKKPIVPHPVEHVRHRSIPFGGRTLLRKGQWFGSHNTWGPLYPVFQQNYGKGQDPAVQWYSRGFTVKAGEKLAGITLTGRCDGTNADAVELRFMHLTGPYGEKFTSTKQATITDVVSVTIPLDKNGKCWFDVAGLEREMPTYGVLVPVFRAVETTSNRVFYFDAEITLV